MSEAKVNSEGSIPSVFFKFMFVPLDYYQYLFIIPLPTHSETSMVTGRSYRIILNILNYRNFFYKHFSGQKKKIDVS